MSEAIMLNTGKQKPQFTSAAPFFKMGGLLPATRSDVLRNYRVQKSAYNEFKQQAMDEARAAGQPYVTPCMRILSITLCFDGTNNHEPSDKIAKPSTTTNVARLYHASLGSTEHKAFDYEGFYAYYMPGVGTEFKEIGEFEPSTLGLMMSIGGENRVNWGLTRLIDALKKAIGKKPPTVAESYSLVQAMGTSVTEDAFGASLFKSSYARREEVLKQPLAELKSQIDACHSAKSIAPIRAMRLFVYGFSRGAAEARAFATWLEALTKVEVEGSTCYLFAGVPIKIVFMGLFDTVASVGIPYVVPFAAGHMSWADGSMRLPDSEAFLEHCVHMVAAHEQRGCFPVDSIRRKANPDDPQCVSTYRNGTYEFVYPGMHSDVGGGYPAGDQGRSAEGGHDVLSQIALHHMFDEAYKVGAPLQAPKEALTAELEDRWPWLVMDGDTRNEYDIGPTLINRFNTWLDNMDNGPLEEVMAREAGLITGWRINRYAKGRARFTRSYQNVMKVAKNAAGQPETRDMSADEITAFQNLHQLQLAEDVARLKGESPPVLSEADEKQRDTWRHIKRGYEARTATSPSSPAFNTSKAFEPNLDCRQLVHAMEDFRRDYVPDWTMSASEVFSLGTLANTVVGGLVYMTNSQDEAQHYARLRAVGEACEAQLFDYQGKPVNDEAWLIVGLFDEHVHDSRAWFMNSALNERELFSDYFRYRGIFFDNESNNELSLVVAAGQVIGVGLAVASVGLSIRRNDPRFLLGLIMPTLGTPVFRGKVGFPIISAFDTITGRALPMLEGLEAIRAYTKDPGSVVKAVKALPAAAALTEENATTDELIAVLKGVPAPWKTQQQSVNRDVAYRTSPRVPVIDNDDRAIAALIGEYVVGAPCEFDIDSIV